MPGRLPRLHRRVRLCHGGCRRARRGSVRHRACDQPVRLDLRSHLRCAVRACVSPRQCRCTGLDPRDQTVGVRALRQRYRQQRALPPLCQRTDAATQRRIHRKDRGDRLRRGRADGCARSSARGLSCDRLRSGTGRGRHAHARRSTLPLAARPRAGRDRRDSFARRRSATEFPRRCPRPHDGRSAS